MQAIEESDVDEYSLYSLKKLSNHHKAYLFALLSSGSASKPILEWELIVKVFNDFL